MSPPKMDTNGIGRANVNDSDVPGTVRWLIYFAERYGIPTVLLVVGVWWFATKVGEPLVKSHVEFLQNEQKNSVQIIETQKQSIRSSETLIEAQKQSLKTLDTVAENNKAFTGLQIKLIEQSAKQTEVLDKLSGFGIEAKADHKAAAEKLDGIDRKLPAKP